MTRYADPERCPDCLSAMPYGARACPTCGLTLEGDLAVRLFNTLSTADEILEAMRAPAAAVTSAAVTRRAGGGPDIDSGSLDLLEWPAPAPGETGAGGGGVPRVPLTAADHDRHRLSATSVPKILLGLGALCLLIAALVFLAVTWSQMGVGGRTATLVGFTITAAGLTAWAARHDLRAAAESLGIVSLGLLSLDLVGARAAGWLGDISTPGFLVALGTVLVVAGSTGALAVRRTPVGAFTGAEIVAVLGLVSIVSGITGFEGVASSAAFLLSVLVAAGVTVAAHWTGLRVATVAAGLVTGLAWIVLTLSSLDRAFVNPSLLELWRELEAWPLVAATALAGVVALVARFPQPVRLLGAGTAAFLTAILILVPLTDGPLTTAVLGAAGILVAASALTWFLAKPWRPALGGVLVAGTVLTLLASWVLVVQSADRLAAAVAEVWSGLASDRLPAADPVTAGVLAGWTLPVLVVAALGALLTLAHLFGAVDRVLGPLADLDTLTTLAVLTVVATLGLYGVPLWVVVGLLLAPAAALLGRGLAGDRGLPLALGAALAALALLVSLHAEGLTLAVAGVVLVASASVHLRWPTLEVAVGAGSIVAVALAGVIWTAGAVADGRGEWTAVLALGALAVLLLGLPYVDAAVRRNSPVSAARLGPELGALAAAAVLTGAGISAVPLSDEPTWLAVYLTLAGATAAALALLRPDRREAGWLGGLLLAAATWVRLADLGVDEPEAYTLPTAIALVAVGLYRLRTSPETGSFTALTPGLGLALVPSLLWVLVDPVTLRSVLLGAACLGLVMAGARLRWGSPLVLGALVGAAVVLRHATPIAEAVPRWALIGAAGVLLVTMGITWERRLKEARAVAGYVRGLR